MIPGWFINETYAIYLTGVVCPKANLMDDNTPVETSITVSSNPGDDIEETLSKDDDIYWKPDESDDKPEITVEVTEEEEPITDVIVNGEFEEFTVTVLDKDDKPLVEEKVSSMILRSESSCNRSGIDRC